MPPIVAAVGAGLASIGAVAATAAAAGTFLGITAVGWAALSVAISIGATLLRPKPGVPRVSNENLNRLRANIDPKTGRKTWVGITAGATDIRDEEFTSSQAYFHRFIVCASHAVEEITEIWFDDELAWSLSGGVASKFTGYLTVSPVPLGNTAYNISSRMGSSRKFTGLANVHITYKLTGNSKKAESPFAQNITTRITIRGKGAKFYDPRLDSTVSGGSGTHRADDQSTWEWDDTFCRNPALALLFYLLGWRIKNPTTMEWQLVVGKGIPAERIDLESFITAANICEEAVTLDAGGTEQRYTCDGVWSEDDSTGTVLDMLKATMNADLDDVDGKIRITIFEDETGVSDADFTDEHLLEGFDWQPVPPLADTFNIVRGVFSDPSDNALYQPRDYPEVSFTSPDGIDRIMTLNMPMVQSATQARRLADLRLKRQESPGAFRCVLNAEGWRCQKNSIVRLTFAQRGWTNKVFRVAEYEARIDGRVPVLLVEEYAGMYVEPAAATDISPADPSTWDPFKEEFYLALLELQTNHAYATLDPPSRHIPVDKTGAVTSYSLATTKFRVRLPDGTDISDQFTLSIQDNPDGLTSTINNSANPRTVSVTAGIASGSSEEIVTLMVRATGTGDYSDLVIDRLFTIFKNVQLSITRSTITNFDLRNDRDGSSISAPTVASGTGGVYAYSKNTDGTYNCRLIWSDSYTDGEIDGFEVLAFSYVTSNSSYAPGDTPSLETRFFVPADQNYFNWPGCQADKYWYFAVRAFRVVDDDVAATGRIYSAWAKSSDRWPFQPSSSVVYSGKFDTLPKFDAPGAVLIPIYIYNNGTVDIYSGQLPWKGQFKHMVGETDVSASSTWSIESYYGAGASVTGGLVTMSAAGSQETWFVVKSVYQGTSLRWLVTVRYIAGPPSAGQYDYTRVPDADGGAVTTTSTPGTLLYSATATAGSTGAIDWFALFIAHATGGSGGTGGGYITVRYRPAGVGSYTDAGSQSHSLEDEDGAVAPKGQFVGASGTLTGLTADADYDILVYARRNAVYDSTALRYAPIASGYFGY